MKKLIFLTIFILFMLVGCGNNLQWSEKSPDPMSWNDGVEYCKNLNEGDHNDWRLPNIDELRTLIQAPQTISGGKCPISEKAGKLSSEDWSKADCACISKLGDHDLFWSSSVRADNPDNAWHVDFYGGTVYNNNKSLNKYVRCVRSDNNNINKSLESKTPTKGTICTGLTKCYNNEKEIPCPKSPKDEFFGQDAQYAKKKKCKPQSFQIKTVSNQNIVIDKNTGLIWQQSIPKEKYKWKDAVNYCENLTYAGYSDWRLPTPQELLTIIDNSKSNPAIDTTYFQNNTPSDYFWSSPVSGLPDLAWYVNFGNGGVYDGDRKHDNYNHYVRCVR